MSNLRTKATNFNDLRKEFREQELTFVSTHGVNESLKETYVSYIYLNGVFCIRYPFLLIALYTRRPDFIEHLI